MTAPKPFHWRRLLLRWAGIAGAVYLLVVVAMFLLQRQLLYFPSHEERASLLSPWQTEQGVIGFCREVAEPNTIWLMTHGNAGQAADRDYVVRLLPNDDSLYVLEYPGYGSRAGRPTQESINLAAREAFRLLRAEHPNTSICVLGESIGSGPACMLANEPSPPEKIVLAVPYDSLPAVAANHLPLLPARFLILDRWNNVEALRGYSGPVEILAADDDDIIPPTHAEALARQVPNSRLIRLRGGHNDWPYDRTVKLGR
ncbi:MAG: alpha/beta hydrolase [Planctomycetales bacterium]|nr:alpha/beta hydrolase [Planctomycetales bacterium]